jgi:hypothetical protein
MPRGGSGGKRAMGPLEEETKNVFCLGSVNLSLKMDR